MAGSNPTIPFDSDYLVPKNQPTSCGQAGGISNRVDTDINDPTLQGYWSLIGVVLGSPPFSLNGITNDTDIGALSNVNYGLDKSTTVDNEVEWKHENFFSSGVEVHAVCLTIF